METYEEIGNWYDEQCDRLEKLYQQRMNNACTALEVLRINDWYSVQKKKIFDEWYRRMEKEAEK